MLRSSRRFALVPAKSNKLVAHWNDIREVRVNHNVKRDNGFFAAHFPCNRPNDLSAVCFAFRVIRDGRVIEEGKTMRYNVGCGWIKI